MDSASPGMLRPEASGIWFVACYFAQLKCQVRVCGMHPKPAVNQVVCPLKRFRISQTCMRRNAPRLLASYQARLTRVQILYQLPRRSIKTGMAFPGDSRPPLRTTRYRFGVHVIGRHPILSSQPQYDDGNCMRLFESITQTVSSNLHNIFIRRALKGVGP